jgi:hypothetical protein
MRPSCLNALVEGSRLLVDRRNTRAGYQFLGNALKTMRHWHICSITTDKLGSYPKAIRRLKREGKLPSDTKHRTSKYPNNIIEADHGGIKRVIRPTLGFQTMRTDQRLRDHAHVRMIRRRHCILCQPRVAGEIPFRQQALQHCGLICNSNQDKLRSAKLMQQSLHSRADFL